MLAAALKSCGLKVGLYTSPHILEFNERIRIDGVPVATKALEQGLSRLMPHAIAAGASYFETATALALDQFAIANVDVEILEAGVGARLDASTAVDADMALITPIGIDHQAWLGDTLCKISDEKAFVMAGCRYCLSAPQPPDVMVQLRLFNPELVETTTEPWPSLAVTGRHQLVNASLAYAAVKVLADHGSISCDLKRAREAIAACHVPGRLQKITLGRAEVWLDAAHNRHAVEALLPTLKMLADPLDAILVFTREDRSLEDCIPLLAPYTKSVVTRLESISAPAALKEQLCLHPDGSFLVLGSFITVAEILRHSDQLKQ
ncbi:dihydrofolate synthase [Mariprofundus ferrinatatus]|uniref:Dihydrofolate synthase n=2 Tax=Mariprofundus ferrinatatus TaxID=1921087 RepID=A0A2K8L6Y4_9PROT|nr:dihydrofolate synthase [Mariprofundus ferrinatatus]